MIKAINTIINHSGYPIFTANQVLSKDDLNHLVNYLDEQNRLTRAYFIGMGIVGGLEVSSVFDTTSSHIQISAGCGITSEGYAIALADTKLTHYCEEQLVLTTLFDSQVSTAVQTDSNVIELFAQSRKESLPLNQASDGSLRDETAFNNFFGDRVLVVLCELEESKRDTCRLNYDNLSNELNFNYRFFLIAPNDVAQKLLKTGFSPEENIAALFTARNNYLQEELEQKQFKDFAPKIQRFGYKQSDNISILDLTKISDYEAFWQEYRRICENAIASIDNAFRKLFRLFSPFFSSFNPNSQADFNGLKERLEEILKGISASQDNQTPIPSEKAEPTYAIQYFYDYLSQLVAAFDELAAAAFDLMDDCTPDTQRFPKFLMLGIVPEPNQAPKVYEPASPYRSYFNQPPIYNGNQQRVKQVRYLYDRLINLCQNTSFYLLPFSDTPLKITPSKDSSVPLSEQAIPYYLNYPKIYRYWNYDAYRQGRSHLLPAYCSHKNSDNTPAIPPGEDLVYRLDKHNFYRIEGHIGKANGDVFKRIKEYQKLYNLPFDVITLKVGSQASLQDLNITGQFDDLELDFSRLKQNFQTIFLKEKTASENVLLNTLKEVLFDQPSLTAINLNQVYNPILELARQPEAYEFVKGDQTQTYQLFILDKNNKRIAQYVIKKNDTKGNNFQDFSDLNIDFSQFNGDEINGEQQRIVREIANSLSLEKITYGIVDKNPNYYLKLLTDSVLNLPSKDNTNNNNYTPILLSLGSFTVKNNSEQPTIAQPEFQDIETLYNWLQGLPEEFIVNVNKKDYKIAKLQAAKELNYFEIIQLISTYQRRLEQMIKLHLFNKFAEQYPGVEHLGGVPKGGTFILVYVDGEEINQLLAADKDRFIYKLRSLRTKTIKESACLPPDRFEESISNREKLLQELRERKDVVVGDFCLPYRCSSDAPAINYIIAKPRPIILLEKTVFCENDYKKYQFILEPEGGTVKGEGVVFEGIKQLFQPSSINQASKDDLAKGLEVVITFIYTVNDTSDTLTVTVYPLPNAGFSIGQDPDKNSFCINDKPVSLTPMLADGTFQVLDTQGKVIENAFANNQLYPSAIQLGENAISTQVTLKYTITSSQGCTNSVEKTLTIFALPDANFQVGSDPQKTGFCINDVPVSLTPTLTGGTFLVLDAQGKVIEDAFANNQFYPSVIKIGENETSTQVILKYTITSEQGCTNSVEKTLTIFALPDASFQVGSQENQTSFCANDEAVNLIAKVTGGTFQVVDAQGTVIEDALVADVGAAIANNLFHPSAIKLGDNETSTQVILKYTITSEQGCTNSAQKTLTIFALPDASFQVGSEENQTSFCANDEAVNLIAKVTGGTFQVLDAQGTVIENAFANNLFHPSVIKLGDNETSTQITLKYTISSSQGCTNSAQKTLTIFAVSDANFHVGSEAENQTNICANAQPVKLISKVAGGKFRVLIGDKDISDDVLDSQSNPPQLIPSAVKIGDAQQVTLTIEYTIVNENNCTSQHVENLTVHRVPVGDFEAEISQINANGFSVRVFNIQPAQNSSMRLVWEHPNGEANTSNPDDNQFLISYNYDFNNWQTGAQVSITLQVITPENLGGCISNPVTKNVAIPFGAVQGFNLVIRSITNVTAEPRTIPLGSNNSFRLKELDENSEYAIAAVTIPATLDSIVFTYTAPGDEETVSRPMNTPYSLPDGWFNIVGNHIIQAQPVKEINGVLSSGVTSTTIIRIDDNDTGTNTPTPNPSTPKSATLLNRLRVLFDTKGSNTEDNKGVNPN
ncbi:hypothetical protein [Nostoc sp. MS1]|uniref:hypothetical protein n=1 Tax=Nostoc sp. MS1 TaxID=2764711 RepID=UPI001CC51D5D|nr:hypothetical protein [Nostoc sp. MS1]BCL33737.1 hypothetical protein NSMS1_01840 [Nostoc sp. MS1]